MSQHQHDCRYCVPLGAFDKHDLYFCPTGGGFQPTVLARFGSDPQDYMSGMEAVDHVPELTEAYVRAVNAGLLTPQST